MSKARPAPGRTGKVLRIAVVALLATAAACDVGLAVAAVTRSRRLDALIAGRVVPVDPLIRLDRRMLTLPDFAALIDEHTDYPFPRSAVVAVDRGEDGALEAAIARRSLTPDQSRRVRDAVMDHMFGMNEIKMMEQRCAQEPAETRLLYVSQRGLLRSALRQMAGAEFAGEIDAILASRLEGTY